MTLKLIDKASRSVARTKGGATRYGRVQSVVGLIVEATGIDAAVGELCSITDPDQPFRREVKAEVVGVRNRTAILMPLDETVGLRAGCLVRRSAFPLAVGVGDALLGRVIDAHGRPLDGLGPIQTGAHRPVQSEPPAPLQRRMITGQLRTGVRAIDTFLTFGQGQRIGIFAGSGVGKSTLLGMIARYAQSDVNVIALIGERGREVQEFIKDNLGEEGLARSVVVAVTSDQAAMSRVKGASVATAIAEHFRDEGRNVLLMMDSVTRVAMSQREIGLATGEPPTSRGYTPSVFALLPRLLERAGCGQEGSITGIYSVLVDGDDMNEPVGDAVRGILDGHIVLSRHLAHANHFPAIDVLQSISRVMPRVVPERERAIANKVRTLMADYGAAEDLIKIGAYKKGSSPSTDRAIMAHPIIERFLNQGVDAPFHGDPWKQIEEALAAENVELLEPGNQFG